MERKIQDYCNENNTFVERGNGCVRYTFRGGGKISFHRGHLVGDVKEALEIINKDIQGDRK